MIALALVALSITPATPANAGFAGAPRQAVAFGDAKAGASGEAPPLPLRVDVDAALVDEITGFTAELIRAAGDPADGNKRVVELLAARLEEAGIEVAAKPLTDGVPPSARFNLKAVVHGRDAKRPALLLIGHTALAPADAAGWHTPPFEGAIEGGRLVGRGASDVLADDALFALTLIALKRAAVPLERDVVLVVANDVDFAFAEWPALERLAGSALAGGGGFVESGLSPGEDLVEIDVADKGELRFHLEAHGPPGVVSAPPHEAAADRVAQAVSRVLAVVAARRPRITPPTAQRLAEIGAALGGFDALLLANPALAAAFVPSALEPSTLYRDTCALTSLAAAAPAGAVPSDARATFECRLLPGTDAHALRDDVLRAVDDPRVDLVVDGVPFPSSAPHPDAHVLVDAVRTRMTAEIPGAAVVTTLSADITGCRVPRALGIACVAFAPIRVTSSERAAAHGVNEAVRTAELEKALSRVVDIVASLAR